MESALAPADWQQQCERLLELRSEGGDKLALRLLALDCVDLSTAGVHRTGLTATAGEQLVLICAVNGRARVLRFIVGRAGVDVLRTVDREGWTCTHIANNAAQNEALPMLQWIVQEAGVETLSVANAHGVTPVMRAAQYGHLDVVKWIVAQLGTDCLRVVSNTGKTAIFSACHGRMHGHDEGQLAVLEYTFDVLGGAALRVADSNGITPLHVLMLMPAARGQTILAHLRRLLAVPDEQPALLCAAKRLALAKVMHARLGAGSAAAFATHDVLQKITCESGLQSERETFAQVARWREEVAAAEAAKERALHLSHLFSRPF